MWLSAQAITPRFDSSCEFFSTGLSLPVRLWLILRSAPSIAWTLEHGNTILGQVIKLNLANLSGLLSRFISHVLIAFRYILKS